MKSYDKHESGTPRRYTKKVHEKNKRAGMLPKMKDVAGTLHAQSKRCGKNNCRCSRGELHGPYHYIYHREDGRLRKQYVRQSEVKAAQAQCDARASFKAQERQARQRRKGAENEAREEYRRLIDKLKQTPGGIEP